MTRLHKPPRARLPIGSHRCACPKTFAQSAPVLSASNSSSAGTATDSQWVGFNTNSPDVIRSPAPWSSSSRTSGRSNARACASRSTGGKQHASARFNQACSTKKEQAPQPIDEQRRRYLSYSAPPLMTVIEVDRQEQIAAVSADVKLRGEKR